MTDVTKEQVTEFLNADGNKGYLEEAGFQTTVEKEVQAQYTTEGVESFIKGNQGLRDKLYNSNATKFLKKKLGVEEVTPELLGKDIMLTDKVDDFKKVAAKGYMKDIKYPDLILGKLDFKTINFGETGLDGLDDQLTTIKESYPDLFGTSTPPNPSTPPAPAPNLNKTEKEKLSLEIEELKKKHMTPDNRALIMKKSSILQSL